MHMQILTLSVNGPLIIDFDVVANANGTCEQSTRNYRVRINCAFEH